MTALIFPLVREGVLLAPDTQRLKSGLQQDASQVPPNCHSDICGYIASYDPSVDMELHLPMACQISYVPVSTPEYHNGIYGCGSGQRQLQQR